MKEKKHKDFYELIFELENEDIIKMIQNRFPNPEPIVIISRKIAEHPVPNAYLDVAFYFSNAPAPQDAFYTHFYFGEIEDYLKNKQQ